MPEYFTHEVGASFTRDDLNHLLNQYFVDGYRFVSDITTPNSHYLVFEKKPETKQVCALWRNDDDIRVVVTERVDKAREWLVTQAKAADFMVDDYEELKALQDEEDFTAEVLDVTVIS